MNNTLILQLLKDIIQAIHEDDAILAVNLVSRVASLVTNKEEAYADETL